jgi:hypothetical protein
MYLPRAAAGSYASPLGDDDPVQRVAWAASKPGSTSHQRRLRRRRPRLGSCVRGLFLQNSQDADGLYRRAVHALRSTDEFQSIVSGKRHKKRISVLVRLARATAARIIRADIFVDRLSVQLLRHELEHLYRHHSLGRECRAGQWGFLPIKNRLSSELVATLTPASFDEVKMILDDLQVLKFCWTACICFPKHLFLLLLISAAKFGR